LNRISFRWVTATEICLKPISHQGKEESTERENTIDSISHSSSAVTATATATRSGTRSRAGFAWFRGGRRRRSRTVDRRGLGGFLEGGSSLTSKGWINSQHHRGVAIVARVGVKPVAGPRQYFTKYVTTRSIIPQGLSIVNLREYSSISIKGGDGFKTVRTRRVKLFPPVMVVVCKPVSKPPSLGVQGASKVDWVAVC